MIEFLPLSGGFVGGAGVGAIIGFAIKKLQKLVIKVAAVLAGVQLAVFAFADNQGLITVHWDEMQPFVVDTLGWVSNTATDAAPTLLDTFAATLPAGMGAGAGLLAGYKFG